MGPMPGALPPPTSKDLRAARLAMVLARAVRAGEVVSVDARRVLMHELRGRNTNTTIRIATRSVEAQRVIDEHARAGTPIPKNGSHDALHADHVYGLQHEALARLETVDEWIEELRRLSLVVCVTARENYRLQPIERDGVDGPEKYTQAQVAFVTHELPW